jgi:hypothetical protein
MKLSIAMATLLITTGTALPALAAMPISTSLRDVVTASVEAVQYRQGSRQRYNERYQSNGYRSGYDAWASENDDSTFDNTRRRDANPGRSCVSPGEEGAMSAFPNWAVC